MTDVELMPPETLAQQTPLDPEPFAVPLPDYAVIRVSGAEAHDFLQRILTADVAPADGNQSVLAGLCTAKGRIQFLFRVIPVGAAKGFALVLPGALVAGAVHRLRLFVLRSKVELGHDPDARVTALFGAPQILPEGASDLEPGEVQGGSGGGGPTLVRLPQAPEDSARFWMLHDDDDTTGSGGAGDETARRTWWRSAIRAGEPLIDEATRERFIAQMIDLDRLGGVSFSKGCFPGQEVIARTHYKGTVKQRLAAFRAAARTCTPDLMPGAELRTPEGERLAGHIIQSVATGDGAVEGLASVRTELAEQCGGWLHAQPAGAIEDEA